MKKLSLILVALATMVMVGCKPLTGSTVCPHDWDLTDEVTPTCVADGVKTYTCTLCGETKEDTVEKLNHSNWFVATEGDSVSYDMQTGLTTKKTIDCYGDKCLICNKYPYRKTVAFFDSDTTIGKAGSVSNGRFDKLPIDEKLIKLYNSYYDKVEKTRDMLVVEAEQMYNEVLAETNDINTANNKRNDVLNRYISYCTCECIHDVGKNNKCSCNDTCTCGDPDNCVRSCGNKVYFSDSFGDYYITY